MDTDLAAKAAILAPDTLLRALAAVSGGTDLSERPQVRLRLAAGHDVSGSLLRVGTDGGREVVVLGAVNGNYLASESVYLLMSDVVAVGVLDGERFRDVLTAGALPRQVAERDRVSRLQLRREFTGLPELPLSIDWSALPDSEDATANLGELLAALRKAAVQTQADELGRQAWTGIQEVRVEHSSGQLAIRRVPGGLLVSVDLTAALSRRLEAEVAGLLNSVL